MRAKTSMPMFLFFAVWFGSVGTISSDLYLPSMPSIMHYFHTSMSLVQFSMTTYVLGFASARLCLGISSDAFGRKKPLLFALVICLLGSLLCWHAHGIHYFLLGRAIQGFGAGGSNVIGRIILRDGIPKNYLAKYNAFYSMFGISMMASAPLIGGYVVHYYSWQFVFVLLMLLALVSLLIALCMLPESHQNPQMQHLKITVMVKNAVNLFSSGIYVQNLFSLWLAFGVLIAWLTVGPALLQHTLHQTAIAYGWLAVAAAFCYFCGAFVNSQLVNQLGPKPIMIAGSVIILLGGLCLLVPVLLWHLTSVGWVILPVMLALFGVSLVMSNTYAQALAPFASIAGIAVAILSTSQMLGGALTSAIISWSPDVSQMPLGVVILVLGLLLFINNAFIKTK